MKILRKKLKSRSGESISEVLIAALVVALGALLLVTMAIAAGRIITKSEQTYNTYLKARNVVEARNRYYDYKVTIDKAEGLSVSAETIGSGNAVNDSTINFGNVDVYKVKRGSEIISVIYEPSTENPAP